MTSFRRVWLSVLLSTTVLAVLTARPTAVAAEPRAKVTVDCAQLEGAVGETIELAATVTADGQPLEGLTVRFSVRDSEKTRWIGQAKTDEDGRAVLTYKGTWGFRRAQDRAKVIRYTAVVPRNREYRGARGYGTILLHPSRAAGGEADDEE